MIKIIKSGKNPYVYKAECGCGCEFTCDRSDLKARLQPNGRDYSQYVSCPTCHSAIPYSQLILI